MHKPTWFMGATHVTKHLWAAPTCSTHHKVPDGPMKDGAIIILFLAELDEVFTGFWCLQNIPIFYKHSGQQQSHKRHVGLSSQQQTTCLQTVVQCALTHGRTWESQVLFLRFAHTPSSTQGGMLLLKLQGRKSEHFGSQQESGKTS